MKLPPLKRGSALIWVAALGVLSLLAGAGLKCSSALTAPVQRPRQGDREGLARVAALEKQLDGMAVKSGHPRIMLTDELLALGKKRVASGHKSWRSIRRDADKGALVQAAFVYQMLQGKDARGASRYAAEVYRGIMNGDARSWSDHYSSKNMEGTDRKVAQWAVAFDWVYEGLTEAQRQELIAKIASAANLSGRAAWIRNGNRDAGETMHREEWIFFAWRAWPELALAGHVPEAEFCYRSRWRADWFQGDAARLYAYLNDGTPLEGYQYGADGTSWFMALKSATGVNLVDGPQFHYDLAAADYQLYGTDFGMERNVFHHGVGIGAGGLASYRDGKGKDSNWKVREFHAMAAQLAAPRDPYQQWIARNLLAFDRRGASSWIFSNEYYRDWKDFEDIATLLFYDPELPAQDPRSARYDDLPFAKHFDGGNEVYMRTGWGSDAALACLRAAPAFTKTAHGDFDVNTFLLYRKGNLAPDSGVYDTFQGQTHYMGYQKNTVAHNAILVVDPGDPDGPVKLKNRPDPGGTERVSTRTFAGAHPKLKGDAFLLHDKADWGDIVAFETNRAFDYAVGEGAKAYGSRLGEFTRSMVFLRRPKDRAYVILLDKVQGSQAAFRKKWLLHTVGEPALNGRVTATEVPGHIYTTDADSYMATNAFGTSALYGRILLPKGHQVRKVGGEGYQFWVDGSSPRNWGFDWEVLAKSKEPFMGGPLREIGEWRLEVIPLTRQKRDLFLNVIYLGEAGETPAPVELAQVTEGEMVGAFIDAPGAPHIVLFSQNRHGQPVSGDIAYSIDSQGKGAPTHIISDLIPNASYTLLSSRKETVRSFRLMKGSHPERGTVYQTSKSGILHVLH